MVEPDTLQVGRKSTVARSGTTDHQIAGILIHQGFQIEVLAGLVGCHALRGGLFVQARILSSQLKIEAVVQTLVVLDVCGTEYFIRRGDRLLDVLADALMGMAGPPTFLPLVQVVGIGSEVERELVAVLESDLVAFGGDAAAFVDDSQLRFVVEVDDVFVEVFPSSQAFFENLFPPEQIAALAIEIDGVSGGGGFDGGN